MTEKNWKELIETGEKLQREARNKKLPGEMNLSDFMRESGYGKEKSHEILDQLVAAGLITFRVDGRITYYSPK
jgi:hypothetical protein